MMGFLSAGHSPPTTWDGPALWGLWDGGDTDCNTTQPESLMGRTAELDLGHRHLCRAVSLCTVGLKQPRVGTRKRYFVFSKIIFPETCDFKMVIAFSSVTVWWVKAPKETGQKWGSLLPALHG